MIKITFVEPGGAQHVVEAEPGISLMEVARNGDIPGIDAECGGACACATCHVYLDERLLHLVGPAIGTERELLEFTDCFQEASRLSCQVGITENMRDLVVTLPESQGY